MITFKINATEELMNTPIENLDLSQREEHGLKRTGVMTIGNLLDRYPTMEKMMTIRGLGEKSIRGIIQNLFNYQLSLMTEEQREDYIVDLLSRYADFVNE